MRHVFKGRDTYLFLSATCLQASIGGNVRIERGAMALMNETEVTLVVLKLRLELDGAG